MDWISSARLPRVSQYASGWRKLIASLTAGVAAALVLAVDTPAIASDPFSNLLPRSRGGEALPKDKPRSSVQRYVTTVDQHVFLLETHGPAAHLKFLCGDGDARIDCVIDPDQPAEEILILAAVPGSRGDTLFKNEEGATVLRLGAFGGATVFWPGQQNGAAAWLSYSDDPSLSLPMADLAAARARARKATALVSAVTGAAIEFEIIEDSGSKGSDDAAVLADAIARAASGIVAVARDRIGAKVLAQSLRTVQFVSGDAPSLTVNGATLIVRYSPTMDVRGRPTSVAIRVALEEAL